MPRPTSVVVGRAGVVSDRRIGPTQQRQQERYEPGEPDERR
ncbi:MAG: hypothetical protein AAFQ89_16545 [Cyanobacteria bacterium J06626_18]